MKMGIVEGVADTAIVVVGVIGIGYVGIDVGVVGASGIVGEGGGEPIECEIACALE